MLGARRCGLEDEDLEEHTEVKSVEMLERLPLEEPSMLLPSSLSLEQEDERVRKEAMEALHCLQRVVTLAMPRSTTSQQPWL